MQKIPVNLAYVAADGRLYYQPILVPNGSNIRDALMRSGWLSLAEFEGLKAWMEVTTDETLPLHRAWFVGVFSQKQPLGYVLQAGDRIEVYRPLNLDPMNNRRRKLGYLR